MSRIRGAAIGAGYFSQFHYDGWSRIEEVDLVACCDLDQQRGEAMRERFSIPRCYTDYRQMLDVEKPDFVDVITRPDTHRDICGEAAQRGIHVICQKPLAPTLQEAREMVRTAASHDVRFMVHENFRFQPWHREIKRLLDAGAIGDKLHSLTFRSRPGDGWGEDAYLSRQPYFREMQRFLIYEAGIHFIDTFRFLAGEVARVFCILRKLNPIIAGEDCVLLIFEFQNGAVGMWDANRYNESNCDDPRYTFGEFLVEGNGGTIRLALDGRMDVQPLGQAEREHEYHHQRRGFGGDCCHATQRHFVEGLIGNKPLETRGEEYLKNLAVQESLYQSAQQHTPVVVEHSL